jgi:excisionase family DNA binding protein
MNEPRFTYSVADACRLLGVGRTTLYAAIKMGKLKTRKMGRRTLVTAEALKDLLQKLPSSRESRSETLRSTNDGGGNA